MQFENISDYDSEVTDPSIDNMPNEPVQINQECVDPGRNVMIKRNK